MIASPTSLRPLVLGRTVRQVCSNDVDELAWVEEVEKRFIVMRARHDGRPTKVAELASAPSLAFGAGVLYAGIGEGVVRLTQGRVTPVHVFDERPSELILKGTASLLALVRDADGSWEVLEIGERVRSVGTYDTRPLAVSTMGAVWVAGLHDESVEPVAVSSPVLPGATAAIHHGTWHLESDVASGPELEVGRLRVLVALGTSDERIHASRGGVLFVEQRADGDGIGEVWPDGSVYRYEPGKTRLAIAPYGDGFCWSEGRTVSVLDSAHDEPTPVIEVEPDAIVQSMFALGRSTLLVTSGGFGTPSSLRWHDRK